MHIRDAPTSTLLVVVAGIPAIALGFALLPGNPYIYFQFLRVVVCISVACNAFVAYRLGSLRLTCVLAGISALYNPVLPVHLPQLIWWPVHLLTLVALGAIAWSLLRVPAGTGRDRESNRHRLV
jgi:hypothetical protein